MNKTLILIICDFLLLNLLAVTQWRKEAPRPLGSTVARQSVGSVAVQNQDLVELMRISLQDERASREQLAARLRFVQSDLNIVEDSLAQSQTQKGKMERDLTEAQGRVQEMTQKFAASTELERKTSERLTKIASDLEAKKIEAERQQKNLTELEKQQVAARQQMENLNAAVKIAQAEKQLIKETLTEQYQRELEAKKAEAARQQALLAELDKQRTTALQSAQALNASVAVAEAEKKVLRENLTDLRTEVKNVRQEKDRIQDHATKLASGVGQLAAKSTELTQEIRDNRPLNANQILTDYLSNRIETVIEGTRPGIFSQVTRSREVSTVLVNDNGRIYALLHVLDTPLRFEDLPVDWDILSGVVAHPPKLFSIPALSFLAVDPRVVVISVGAEQAAQLGVRAYPTSRMPNRFPEAILVGKGGRYYGEVEFRLDPALPQYVRMKTKIMSRIFGEFSPATGDLVFAKTGELLGIMVNREYCVVLNNFTTARDIRLGVKNTDDKTGVKLREMKQRLNPLPLALQ